MTGPRTLAVLLGAASLAALLAPLAGAVSGPVTYELAADGVLTVEAHGTVNGREAEILRQLMDRDHDGNITDSEASRHASFESLSLGSMLSRMAPPGGRLRVGGINATGGEILSHGYHGAAGPMSDDQVEVDWSLRMHFGPLDAVNGTTFAIDPARIDVGGGVPWDATAATFVAPEGFVIIAKAGSPAIASDGRSAELGALTRGQGSVLLGVVPTSSVSGDAPSEPLFTPGLPHVFFLAALLGVAAVSRGRGGALGFFLAAPLVLAAVATPTHAASSTGDAVITLESANLVRIDFHGVVDEPTGVRTAADLDGNGTVDASEAEAYRQLLLSWMEGPGIDSPAGRLQVGGRDPVATTVDLHLQGLEGPARSIDGVGVDWVVFLEYEASNATTVVLAIEPGARSRLPTIEQDTVAARVEAGPGWRIASTGGIPPTARVVDGGLQLPGLSPDIGSFAVTFAPAPESAGVPGAAIGVVAVGVLLLARWSRF